MGDASRGRWSALLLSALFAGPAAAQSVVVPNANLATNGGWSINSLFRQTGNPRTVQQAIAASELTGIPVGAEIVGFSLRPDTPTRNPMAWPTTAATWQNYEITLAQAAVPIPQMTTTFAANMRNPVLVRSGSYTIPIGHFVNNGPPGPNPFGRLYFEFQKPYVYRGGDLVVLATHDGNNTGTAIYSDGVRPNTATYGFTCYAMSYQAATATFASTNFMVMRIHYGVGPAGIAGSGGVSPRLVLSNNLTPPTPVPGTAHIAVVSAPPNTGGFLVVGPSVLPTPFGLPNGANLLVSPPFQVVPIVIGANGRFDLALGFPANLVGRFGVQAAIFDPGAPGGAVATNAVLFQLSP